LKQLHQRKFTLNPNVHNVDATNKATDLQELIKVTGATGHSVKIVFVSSDYPLEYLRSNPFRKSLHFVSRV